MTAILDALIAGKMPKAGSQIGRTASCPEGGPTTLLETAK
jgi:NADH-quinone oxidoreductase subunit E